MLTGKSAECRAQDQEKGQHALSKASEKGVLNSHCTICSMSWGRGLPVQAYTVASDTTPDAMCVDCARMAR